MKSITDRESHYLTSKEAISSIKDGCFKDEMCEAFQISKKQLNDLLSGKLDKVKIPRTSIHYEEDDIITSLREAVTDFINAEISLGGEQKDIHLALKNIVRECIEDSFPDKEKQI